MKYKVLVLFLLGIEFSYAQSRIIEIKSENLFFNSEIEKQAILSNSKLDLLFAKDSSLDKEKLLVWKKNLNKLIDELKPQIKLNKSKKNITLICERLNNDFFYYKNNKAIFKDIFLSGSYNQVTGIALYSFLFSEFNIPYYIDAQYSLENPVYNLYAYPKTESFKINVGDKKKLFDLNKPTNLELKSNVNQIVALLYFNDAQQFYIKNDDLAIIHSLEKSYYFSQNKVILKELNQLYEKHLSKLNYENYRDVYVLSTLLNCNKISDEFFEKEFDLMFEKFVEKEHRNIHLDSIYVKMYKSLYDNTLKDKLTYWYNYKMGYFYYEQKQDNLLVLNYLGKCVGLDSTDLNVKKTMIRTAILNVKNTSLGKYAMNKLLGIAEAFPFMKKDDEFLNSVVDIACVAGVESYNEGDLVEGLKILQQLEEIIQSTEYEKYNEKNIVNLYDVAAFKLSTSEEKEKAIDVLHTGLIFFPESNKLQKRLKFVNTIKY